MKQTSLVALLSMITAASVPAQVFTDVLTTDPYYQTTALMFARGITSGCQAYPALYCPGSNLTRGQAAVFLIRSIYSSASGNGDNFSFTQTPYFTDVPASHLFFPYVQKMMDLGITGGCTPTTYCPDQSIANWQLAIFIVRARTGSTDPPYYCYGLGYPYPCQSLNYFPAERSSNYTNSYNYNFIQRAYELVGSSIAPPGCPASQFCADAVVSRAQITFGLVYGIMGLPSWQTWDQWEAELPPIGSSLYCSSGNPVVQDVIIPLSSTEIYSFSQSAGRGLGSVNTTAWVSAQLYQDNSVLYQSAGWVQGQWSSPHFNPSSASLYRLNGNHSFSTYGCPSNISATYTLRFTPQGTPLTVSLQDPIFQVSGFNPGDILVVGPDGLPSSSVSISDYLNGGQLNVSWSVPSNAAQGEYKLYIFNSTPYRYPITSLFVLPYAPPTESQSPMAHDVPTCVATLLCGSPDCTWGYSQITYTSGYQFFGDSTTCSTGPASWATTNYASAVIRDWNGMDQGQACQTQATSGASYVADARVPCSPPTNFLLNLAPSVFTLYGQHQNYNQLLAPTSISFQTYDTLAFQRVGVTWTYNSILQAGFSNIGTSSLPISISPSDGVAATYTARTNNSVSIRMAIPYSAKKGRHQLGFPANDNFGQLHTNQTFAIVLYDDTPTISSVNPSSIAAGSSVTLTITGTAFGDNPTVYFGGNGCSGGTVFSPPVTNDINTGNDSTTITVTPSAAQAGSSLSVCVKSNGAGQQPFTGKPQGSQFSNSVSVRVIGAPTISGQYPQSTSSVLGVGIWWLGTAARNDNCVPGSTDPSQACYWNSATLTATPGPGAPPPSSSSPVYWTFTDTATGADPSFISHVCLNAACSQVSVTATAQPPYCGRVTVSAALAGLASAPFPAGVDWPQSLFTAGPLDAVAPVPVPGYLSTEAFTLFSGCGNAMFGIAWHEEFPTDASGNPAAWNVCTPNQGWNLPLPIQPTPGGSGGWAYGITGNDGVLNALGPVQGMNFDGIGYACGSPPCFPATSIPGPWQNPPQPLNMTAYAWSYQFIFVGSQDTQTLGKYWPAVPNKQVRYADHGRDEAGTWTCVPGR